MSVKINLAIEYFGASDIGMVRTENQDSFGKFPPDNLDLFSDKGQMFIVADGIGGHAGGREASSLAVETISKTFFNSSSSDTAGSLSNAIEEGNKVIKQKASTSEKFGRMGTTSSVLVLKNNIATIGQVGDSKIYRIENNKIEQLTMEHTQLNEMLKEGVLTEEEAKNYPAKSALSRALGMEEKVRVDIIDNILLNPGQTFILCTDGLSKVNKEEILDVVTHNSLKDACSKLISLANDRGGKDNVTVQLVKIINDQTLPKISALKEEKFKPEKRKKSKWLFIIPILILLGVIGFQFSNSFFAFINSNESENNSNLVDEEIVADNNSDLDPLMQANLFFKKASYEKAFILYREVLEVEPMNLEALDGINNIMVVYKKKADELKSEKNFSEALKFYLKIQKEKPEDIEIRNAILLCENQVKYGIDNPVTENINEEASYKINISSIDQSNWSFINIDKSQYEIEKGTIKFYSTSSEKKSILNSTFTDASISADIKIISNPNDNGGGIIIGYNISESGEAYYLLKFTGDKYLLQLISNNSVERLLSVPVEKKLDELNLRVKCSGNLINIYDGMNLINSWKSSEKIYGKVGVYADKNVLVKFQNILISGNN